MELFDIILYAVLGSITFCGLIVLPICALCNYFKEKREEKERQKQKRKKLLKARELTEKTSSLYESILNDYTLLDQTCLLCATSEQTQILNEDFSYNNLKIDIIDDINGEKYNNLIQYITPTICSHFYHNNCLNKYNNTHKKNKIFKTPEKCVFCKLYITFTNMQKFGSFFSKNLF